MASLSIEQQRSAIDKVYDGKKWHDRVRVMLPNQVIAIYNSFLRSGRFNEKEKPVEMVKVKEQQNYIQMTLFDYM